MKCERCGAQNDDASRFCMNCGNPLQPTPAGVPSVTAPRDAPPSRPSSPVATAATVGGLAGILGGAASAIGWFMPWFGLGQLGAGLGSLFGYGNSPLSGLASMMGGGVGGSGFQLMLFALQVPSLVNSFGGMGFAQPRSDLGTLSGIALLIALALVLLPILGILSVRAGVLMLPLRAEFGNPAVAKTRTWLDGLSRNAVIGFVLMVAIFILLSQIPFATMLLSSGFFITAGAFLLTWLAALFAKSQIKPVLPNETQSGLDNAPQTG